MNPIAEHVFSLGDLRAWARAGGTGDTGIRLAVFGDPVNHSASPPMQQAALDTCGIPATYARIRVSPEEAAEAFRLLHAAKFIGANVTIPHKAAALAACDEPDARAVRAGSANTLLVRGEKLAGFTTDGPGLVRALRAEFSVDLRDLRVLLLGACGGAGRAIAFQCAEEGCERLVLVNRTREKANALFAELAPSFSGSRLVGPAARLALVPWEDAAIRAQMDCVDLVINASPVGLSPADPSPLSPSLIAPHLMVFDTIYNPPRTPLLRAAEHAGARAANGLSMLLHQGALSFEIWFGREAPLATMRKALLDCIKP